MELCKFPLRVPVCCLTQECQVEIDVPYTEYQAAQPVVKSIMWPCQTVMDLVGGAVLTWSSVRLIDACSGQSLAMALYFAAQGIGRVRSGPDAQPEPYTSPARVLLNGLGSDELLGGYGRHRTAFHAGGWQAVIDEVRHQKIASIRISDVIFLQSASTRNGSHSYTQSRP